jgi:hypothetical protein
VGREEVHGHIQPQKHAPKGVKANSVRLDIVPCSVNLWLHLLDVVYLHLFIGLEVLNIKGQAKCGIYKSHSENGKLISQTSLVAI